jgi:phosphatidylinositol alpha-1,6-mannosyltransferase
LSGGGFYGKARFALRLAARQLAGHRAFVFDLLGLARVESYLPRAARAPYLVPMYGIDVWQPLSWDRKRALREATVRFAISRYTLTRARSCCDDLAGTEVVPLTLEERAPDGVADAALVARAGEGWLLIVGRMAEGYKGHDELLAALVSLPRARLVVVGEGDDRARLEAKAVSLGLEERVTFTGFVSEATLAELYARCAAFVMPSRGEGFGLVYLEAMRAGKPVIAAKGGAAEEIVVDGATGLLVDPDDRAALAGAVAELLDDPERARAMGKAGRERYLAEFGYETFYRRMEPLLERLTAASARPLPFDPLSRGPSPPRPSSPKLGEEGEGPG